MEDSLNRYQIRNMLWKAGNTLFESTRKTDRRYAQLLTDLGYRLGNLPNGPNAEEEFYKGILEAVDFAKTCKV